LDGQSKTAFLNSRLEPSLLTPQEKDLRFNLNGSSSDQLLSSIASHTGPPPAALQQAFDIGSMKDPVYPLSSSDENALGHGVTQDMKVEVKARKPHNFRLKPTLGREVSVTGQIDIGKALRLMEMSCSRNRVRTDARVQRFHERPGLKRKRLAKERWRRRFMEGFRATVLRVKQLRNQGW
jgi:ribosomal protein S21